MLRLAQTLLALALAVSSAGGLAPASPAHVRSVPVAQVNGPQPAQPLAGRTVVVDPGHQLGNASHPAQTGALVDAGGFTKPCNTTGTATDAGYPESTFAFGVARRVRDRLERLGATVIMSRHSDSAAKWGPCVDVRGKLGNKGFRHRATNADVKLSIHGDGAAGDQHGFHLIIAEKHRAKEASTTFAHVVRRALGRAGFDRSTYIGGGTALDFRGDLGTLNLAHFPTVLAELGNMRNAGEAQVMSSARGQRRYARALSGAIATYLLGH